MEYHQLEMPTWLTSLQMARPSLEWTMEYHQLEMPTWSTSSQMARPSLSGPWNTTS